MKDPNCIFCKIIAGDIPCMKIYEDEHVLSFLDIGPLAEGHVLVIPKDHYVRLDDMDSDAVANTTRVLPKLVDSVVRAMGVPGCNILQNNGKESGQVVMHVHFHIIPRVANDGLGYRWNASEYPKGRAEAVHQQLIDALAGA